MGINEIDKLLRSISQDLGDMLKQPENADLKTSFLAYDAKTEKGWAWLTSPTEDDLHIAKSAGVNMKPSMFTPEQTERWEKLVVSVGMDEMTGGMESFIFLLTQSYLGKLDVWEDETK